MGREPVAEPPDSPPSPHALTAAAVATAWVEAVMDRSDLAEAWAITEPVLRLVLAQDWVWTNRHHPDIGHDQDWDSIARGLADCPPDHPLWETFASQVLARWQESWAGLSTFAWQAEEAAEVVTVDTELVTFVRRQAGDTQDQAARRFTLRHRGGRWAVASVSGGQMFVPGWPPSPAG